MRVRTVGVLGSGLQARYQVQCLRLVREFTRLVAWSPTRARLEAYCAEMRAGGYDASSCENAEAVCREADVLVTATPSRTPLVRGAWLRPGQHITAVGSDSPGKRELASDCFARADLVVADRLSQCAAFGELNHASVTDAIELGAIVAGRARGRTRDEQITIADLTGVGFQDTAIASVTCQSLVPRP